MSQLPMIKITLDPTLTDAECADVVKKMKEMKGLLGFSFNKASKAAVGTYAPGRPEVLDELRQTKGIVKVASYDPMRDR